MDCRDAVVSFRKGLRTRYALVLTGSSVSAELLPVGETDLVSVDRSNASKFLSVCDFETTGAIDGFRPKLVFHDPSIPRALGIATSSSPEASGFDKYPLVSPFGPALMILACRPTNAWEPAHVMSHLANLAETTPGADGFNGTERLFLDAVRLGVDADLAPHVSIDPARQLWLSALAAAASGKFERALDNCSKLTPGTCVERNTVIALAIQSRDWSGKQEIVLGALDEMSPGGSLIAHVIGNKKLGREQIQAEAATLASWISDKTESAWSKRCVKSLSIKPFHPVSGSVFVVSDSYRVAAFLSAQPGSSQRFISDIAVDTVQGLSLEVIDELIERKAITKADLEVLESTRPRDATYLTLRLSPDTLSESQLAESAAHQELVRRQVIDCLEGTSGVVSGPGATLVKLRDGQPASMDEIECLPEGWKSTARRLSEFLTTSNLELAADLVWDPTLLSIISKHLADRMESLPRKGPLADLRASQNLRDALRAVLETRWSDALDMAKEVMRCTEREDLRDEALNLMACAHWQMGNDDEAIGALRSALEGEYNSALQINVGVVASNLEPVIATEHLGRLASEAPSAKFRVQAVNRGMQLWLAGLGEDDESPIPNQLLESLRSLAVDGVHDPTITNDEYWDVLYPLSVHDSEWLTTSLANVSESATHGREHMVDVAVARANNPADYVKAVGRLKASTSPWCREQRESIVDLVLTLQVNDPLSVFAAVMGMELLKTDITVPDYKAVKIRCLTLAGVCDSLDEDAEPIDEVQRYLKDARDLMGSCTPEEQADLKPFIGFAGKALLICLTSSRGSKVNVIAENTTNLANSILGIPRRRLNTTAIRDAVRPWREICRITIRDLTILRQYADDDELLKWVDAVIAHAGAVTKFFDEVS